MSLRTLLFLAAALFVALLAGCTASGPPLVAVADNKTLKAISYDPSSGSLLKVTQGGVFRARDAAATWVPLPLRGPLPLSGLSQVAVSWKNPEALIASGDGAGVYLSSDGGQNWTAINSGLPSKQVGAVTAHTYKAGTLYAWLEDKSVHKTEDGGGSWKRMDDGPPVSKVLALAHSTLPGSMNTGWLYAASPEGLYLSMDCF